jgi:hypothetical protein
MKLLQLVDELVQLVRRWLATSEAHVLNVIVDLLQDVTDFHLRKL